MGQKVNPTGIRLGIIKESSSRWYATTKEFASHLYEDLQVRRLLKKHLARGVVGRVDIERPAKNAKITIHTSRPGVIIGKNGQDVEILRNKIGHMLNVPVHINIEEIRKPDLDAKLVAESIAMQLEKRVSFRRAMKRSVQNTMRAGALGIKVCVGGRLGGAEIARSEWYREGRVPLHTFRADIDYATARANTTYGVIGVKIWIFKGEVTGEGLPAGAAAVEQAPRAKPKKRGGRSE
ncbi:MAG: 30S ribosomal protein S3 [Gammaproteobacteria bacterium CG11_big_fil_rev_8_21_14_0_20_46_22]|nr:MAG: 30S ribosomal protein S3 [Gammaproteobacteria bacterium CG12_big_fil_rev_8_21_14_0_65_46_12]PIR11313.1 MAG: 30S ribosomal protein S3 [Gammaproteobacteria bacterium CG11_big_fil_rev_8_21_14_0_20_46_22]